MMEQSGTRTVQQSDRAGSRQRSGGLSRVFSLMTPLALLGLLALATAAPQVPGTAPDLASIPRHDRHAPAREVIGGAGDRVDVFSSSSASPAAQDARFGPFAESEWADSPGCQETEDRALPAVVASAHPHPPESKHPGPVTGDCVAGTAAPSLDRARAPPG